MRYIEGTKTNDEVANTENMVHILFRKILDL